MFKLDLEFKVGGRRVSANRFGTEFAAAAKQSIQEEILGLVRSASCPVHHRAPSNVEGWPNVSFGVCCDELRAAVSRILK